MSRFRIFFLFAALIALPTAFAACGDNGGSSGANPQQVIDNATLQGIESGNLDLSLGLDVQGEGGGTVDVSLSGPFQSQAGSQQLPQLDLTAKASGSIDGEDIDFEGGLVLLSDRAYLNYDGADYEVDPTTFSFVKSALRQAQQQNNAQSQVPDVTACQNAVGKLQVGDFIDNLTNEGTTDAGGASTTQVSGDLNIGGAIDAFVSIAEDPACASQLGAAGPLPSEAELNEAKGQVESALKTARVDVYVGEDDIVRRISAELAIEPPAGSGGDSGPESVDLTFDLTIEGVNEEQTIEAPEGAKPLNDLFLKLGVNPISLLDAAQGGPGAPGLGDLLGGLGGASGGAGGGSRQAYLKCLQGATTPADLQRCAEQNR